MADCCAGAATRAGWPSCPFPAAHDGGRRGYRDGLIDALEIQVFDPTLESPPIREWYRYLDAGCRLPLVGGTDRMSAEVPLGQVRTWARLDPDTELTFEAWARAIRAGRTFVTSGPVLELRVDGRGPGDSLDVTAGGHVEVEVVARAARPVVSTVEVVLDGRVVAATTRRTRLRGRAPGADHGRAERLARRPESESPRVALGLRHGMAAHTPPVWVEVPGGRDHRRHDPALALVDGTRAWLETLAPIADEGTSLAPGPAGRGGAAAPITLTGPQALALGTRTWGIVANVRRSQGGRHAPVGCPDAS